MQVALKPMAQANTQLCVFGKYGSQCEVTSCSNDINAPDIGLFVRIWQSTDIHSYVGSDGDKSYQALHTTSANPERYITKYADNLPGLAVILGLVYSLL